MNLPMNQEKLQLAIMLGERTGLDINVNEVLEDNNFIYYHNPDYPEEVEVYEKPLSFIAEPWDHLPVSDSPFGGAA